MLAPAESAQHGPGVWLCPRGRRNRPTGGPKLDAGTAAGRQALGRHIQAVAYGASGQPESLSRCVAALMVEGAEPASIIGFLFAERAAAELRERVGRRVEQAKGRDFLRRLAPVFVGLATGAVPSAVQELVCSPPRGGRCASKVLVRPHEGSRDRCFEVVRHPTFVET